MTSLSQVQSRKETVFVPSFLALSLYDAWKRNKWFTKHRSSSKM